MMSPSINSQNSPRTKGFRESTILPGIQLFTVPKFQTYGLLSKARRYFSDLLFGEASGKERDNEPDFGTLPEALFNSCHPPYNFRNLLVDAALSIENLIPIGNDGSYLVPIEFNESFGLQDKVHSLFVVNANEHAQRVDRLITLERYGIIHRFVLRTSLFENGNSTTSLHGFGRNSFNSTEAKLIARIDYYGNPSASGRGKWIRTQRSDWRESFLFSAVFPEKEEIPPEISRGYFTVLNSKYYGPTDDLFEELLEKAYE